METKKKCNKCLIDKSVVADFRINSRRCKACQNNINKSYSKTYYENHKDRLIKDVKNNYYIKTAHIEKKKVGRPRNPAYYKLEPKADDNNL